MNNIQQIIKTLEHVASSKPTIFRGENENFGDVTSNLHRELREQYGSTNPLSAYDLLVLEQLIADDCKRYLNKPTETNEALWEIQHYGGLTNLIDFTSDFLIALYFACESSFERAGRVICLPKISDYSYEIQLPDYRLDRAEQQRSVFVHAPTGVIPADSYTVVKIPKHLKRDILDHLWREHGIFTKSVYHDIHGYISHQTRHLDAWVHASVGQELIIAGNFKDAFQPITEAIQEYYHWPNAYNLRGYSLAVQDDHEKAIEDYNHSLRLDPKNATTYCNRGAAYFELGQFEFAIHDFQTALKWDSSLEGAHVGLGWAYKYTDQSDNSGFHFEKAKELAPNNILMWSHVGTWHLMEKQFDLAIQAFDTALSINYGRYEKLTSHFRGMHHVEFDQVRLDILHNRGVAFILIKDYHSAVKDFEAANNIKKDPSAFGNCGLAWLHMQNWDQSLENLLQAKEMGEDVKNLFVRNFDSISKLERKFNVEMSSNLKSFLRGCGIPE